MCDEQRGALLGAAEQGKDGLHPSSEHPPCDKGYLWCHRHPGGDFGKQNKQEEMPTTAKGVILQHHPNCAASRWRNQAQPGLFTPVSRALGRVSLILSKLGGSHCCWAQKRHCQHPATGRLG